MSWKLSWSLGEWQESQFTDSHKGLQFLLYIISGCRINGRSCSLFDCSENVWLMKVNGVYIFLKDTTTSGVLWDPPML